MIQIDDSIVIIALTLLFASVIGYILYFKIKKKLFPKQIDFQKDIKPNEALPVLSLDGSGIIKRIKIETTENENSLVNILIDKTNYVALSLDKKIIDPTKSISASGQMLDIELQIDKTFNNSFSIFIYNQSSLPVSSNVKIDYEIKEPLGKTLKAVLSGF